MNIKGQKLEVLKNWITDAYDEAELTQLLDFRMDFDLNIYSEGSNYDTKVFNLIRSFRSDGSLPKFIKVAREGKPNNPFLRENLPIISEIERESADGGKIDEIEPSPVGLSSEESFYKDIADNFSFGTVIPFLCAGVDLCDPLSINPIVIAEKLAQDLRGKANFCPENFLSLSCSVCDKKVEQWSQQEGNITEECAFLEKIKSSKLERQSDSQQSGLSKEQKLALAKINLRLLSQYFQSDNKTNFYNKIRQICRKQPESPNNDQRNLIHTFLAKLPKKMRDKNFIPPYKLIVTTSYDDSLERAFYSEKEPFDLVYYVADGEYRGKFKHMICDQFTYRTYDDFWEQEKPKIKPLDSKSEDLLKGRPTILKLYGTWRDNFVITEDHYLSYLSSDSVSKLLPNNLLELLIVEQSQILLLGYRPSYFDLELIFNRFVVDQKQITGDFFMVHQSKPGSLEERIWAEKRPKRLKSALEEFIKNLDMRIDRISNY